MRAGPSGQADSLCFLSAHTSVIESRIPGYARGKTKRNSSPEIKINFDHLMIVPVALFKGITGNENWSFQASKMTQKKSYKYHNSDLCNSRTIFKVL